MNKPFDDWLGDLQPTAQSLDYATRYGLRLVTYFWTDEEGDMQLWHRWIDSSTPIGKAPPLEIVS